MNFPLNIDAYAPGEIAKRVSTAGVAKATLPALPMFVLALLAGAFIAFGGMLFTLAVTDSGLGYGPGRLLGGLAFSLGLILVVIGGAELFTGNNLIVMAWAEERITLGQLMRNWGIVYTGNLIGSLAMALGVFWSGILNGGGGGLMQTAISIAEAKVALSPLEAFLRGIFCNVLVCLAIWLCFAAHSVSGKILAIVFPITAFVALGFEHSVANMYLIPVGMLAGAALSVGGLIGNLLLVTAGNVIGGGVLVALVYWLVYLNDRSAGIEPDKTTKE
ncbi:MAG: formate/nitrite transporter family protein [Proteobacteria bacterium]|nr:formate/nitrite transporter family protein [Pseudomonadota bacterium]